MCDKDETMGGLSKGRLLNSLVEQATQTVDKTKSKLRNLKPRDDTKETGGKKHKIH